AEFTRRFRLRLRPDVRRFEPLLGLSLVSLRTIDPLVHRRTPLFGRLRRRHRWRTTRPRPWARSCRSAWCRTAALEAWCRWVPGLSLSSRTHRPLSRPVIRPVLPRRWRRRQSMFFLQTFLHDLLHRLALFVRWFDDLRRHGRSDSRW